MKFELFNDVLKQIAFEPIKNFTIEVLKKVDPIIEKIPAASSGKYHPPECCQAGGLIIHIQRACYFANMFFNSYKWENKELKADIVLSALLLHDIGKKEKYKEYWEYVYHPNNAAIFIQDFKSMLPEGIYKTISNCILHHQGPWSAPKTKKPMEQYTFLEMLTYQSDYLASRKEIEIKA